MNIPYVFKKCSKCGEWLVASTVNFHKMKKGKYGLRGKCKKCRAKDNKQYYGDNKEKIKQYYGDNKEKIKQYREDNKEKIKQYREDNKEYYKEYKKQYKSTPQGQAVLFNSNARRRIKEDTQGNGINKDQWLECMKFFNWKCAYSGEPLNNKNRTIDHIKPLNKGGEHEVWNCVPMFANYNFSKNAKDMLEWYKEQEFYSEERLQKIYEWQKYSYEKWGNDLKAENN